MHLLAQFIAIILGLFLASQSVGGFVVGTFGQVIAIALLLFVSQRTIKPAITVLTLPFTVISFGLFTIVINGFLVWFLAKLLGGFSVTSFGVAILGSLVISACIFLARLMTR
jgi:putative membrane protein